MKSLGMMETTAKTPLSLAAVAVAVAMVTLCARPVLAEVPATMLIQGVLLTKAGGPATDGVYDIAFVLYGSKTGGQAAWTESAKVAVQGGEFSHILGSVKPISAASLVSLKSLWISMKVASEPEMARKQLHAVAFARRAAIA